ncbi:MAG: serine hydrolase [Thermacetogeniaceae bacterium]
MRKHSDYYSKRVQLRKRRLLFKRVRCVLMLLALVFALFFLHSLVSIAKNLPQQIKQSPELQKIQSTSQELESTPQQDKESENLGNLKTEIASYLKNYKGQYGVYYYDILSGQEFGINDEDQYTGASDEKIPINLYLYNKIKSGAVNPEGTLTYLQEDYEGGTGGIQYEKVGTRYTVEDLSGLSIVDSDNVAANMLIRFLGMQNIKDYMQQVGGQVVVDGQNVSSPRDMGLYMKLVYEFCENNGTLGDDLMNNFLNTDFNDRLPALLPKSVKVAHKIGNDVGVVNDVGIVFAAKPYIVAVMSKGVNEEEAPSVIANISKMIYDSVTQE